jgi:uncharacterized protein
MKYFKIAVTVLFFVEIGIFAWNETAGIMVSQQEIKDNELAGALEGVKIVQISDLHIKRSGYIENNLVDIINKIDPQVIFITGDFLTGNDGIAPCRDTLKRFTKGRVVIGILGNGDHTFKKNYIDTELLAKELENAGVKLLRNESMMLRVKRSGSDEVKEVYVIGLDDNYLMYDDIFKAMNNVPDKSPKILLAHSPNIIDKVNTDGINLILSGHTHGGQISIPYFGPLFLNMAKGAKRKMVAGLYDYETKVFVTKGVGTSLVPLRLFCRPEVSVLEFKKLQASSH